MQVIPFMVAGAQVMQGIAGYQSQRAAAKAAEYQGEIAMDAAREEARRIRREGQAKLSEMRAIFGAQGTTMEGSPMLVYLDAVKEIELEAETRLHKGRLEKYSAELEAGFRRRQAGATLLTSAIGAAGSAYGGFKGLSQSSTPGTPLHMEKAGTDLY